MKNIIIIILLTLISCVNPEQVKKEREGRLKQITIKDLKTIGCNKPGYYIIDKEKNSYEVYASDYVRVEKGDSILIDKFIMSEIKKIYK